MGQGISVGERIHKAARTNDLAELQALCRDMRLNGALDAATKRSWLNWTDADGRTSLQWASQRGFVQAAQALLEEGADVHLIAPKRPAGGSALAEAVAGKHEALVELLLRYGADPFSENPSGRTPMDLALDARCVALLRMLERHALFSGNVSMKVLQLKGFSHAAKDRWVVVAPRFTPPGRGSGGVGLVRVVLLAYRNAAEAEPRTRIWLDGSSMYRVGDEAVLRLHPNHEQPRSAFTKYDQGWLLFFKQASPAALLGAASGPADAAAAAAAFAAFMSVCYRPLDTLLAQQQLRGVSAATGAAATAAAAAPPPSPSAWQRVAVQLPAPPAAAALPATSGVQHPGVQTTAVAPHPGTAAAAAIAATPAAAAPLATAGWAMQPAGAPPASAQLAPGTGAGAAGTTALQMAAAPGESDEQFARRLASALGSEHSSATGSVSQSRTNSISQVGQARLQPSAAALLQTAAAGAAPPPPPTSPHPRPLQQQPQQQLLPLPRPQPAVVGPMHAGLLSGVAAAATVPPTPAPDAPSAPPAPAAAAAAGPTGSDAEASDAECCVICLSAPREVGFLHGASVHRCVCRECALLVSVGTPCPMCRQSIERVIGVY